MVVVVVVVVMLIVELGPHTSVVVRTRRPSPRTHHHERLNRYHPTITSMDLVQTIRKEGSRYAFLPT